MANGLPAFSPHKEPFIDHYELLHTIGQGSFGKVTLARHIWTGSEVAVKAIGSQGSCGQTEVNCLRLLNHPNIVKLCEVTETPQGLLVVMGHVRGVDLHRCPKDHHRLSEKEARHVFRQVASARRYCRQRNVVHRDLRPENVLLDAELNVRITGFGATRNALALSRARSGATSPA